MPVLVHDNLDSNFVWLKVLTESHTVFADSAQIVPNMMGGLPRGSFDSELNVIVWLYAIFPPFTAYVLNLLLISGAAFAGMWLLADRHLAGTREPGSQADESARVIAIWVAFAFALLPFWPGGGLSVAGLPLALYAFLNVREHGGRWSDWLIILGIPFYSSIVLSFAFFLLLGLIFLHDMAQRTARPSFVVATFAMAACYVLVEHRLVAGMFLHQGAVSHRVEFRGSVASNSAALELAWHDFVRGQYHAASVHTYVLMPVTLACALMFAGSGRRGARQLLVVVALCVAAAAMCGLLKASFMHPTEMRIPLLRTFNFGRVHFMHPLLWHVGFALSLLLLAARWPKLPPALWMLPALAQVVVLGAVGQSRAIIGGDRVPYRKFYATEQVEELKRYIGKPPDSYRVASLGIDPAVALYNGLYTVDGYCANYPIDYKRKFREVIAGELARDAKLRDYFDGWGSRAYLYSSALSACSAECTKGRKPTHVHGLQFDMTALAHLGARYLLSAVTIDDATRMGLRFMKRFESPGSAWHMSLYEVAPRP